MKILSQADLSTRPDAILFDLDNTLYPYDPAHEAAIAAVRAKVGASLSLSPERFDELFEKSKAEVKARLNGTACSHHRLLYFQCLLDNTGLGSQVLLALDLEQTYWRVFLDNARLFDDVTTFLDEVRLAGIPMALVTDLTAQIQFRKMIFFGLDRFFDAVVTSEEAGIEKPASAPFELAIRKLAPKGRNIWMIGDNPVNDISGARKVLGASTIQKLHAGVHQGTGECAPDATFHEFSELTAHFARIGLAPSAKP